MPRRLIVLTGCIAAVVFPSAVFGAYELLAPVDIWTEGTEENEVLESTTACALNQKELYQYVQAYVEDNGVVPDSWETMQDAGYRCMHCAGCPEGQPYTIHKQSYGDPNAVFISDRDDYHAGSWKLWIRGVIPRVQTMGDGKVQLFEGGKVLTMDASK